MIRDRYQARRIRFGILGSTWGVWDRKAQRFVKGAQLDLMKWHSTSKSHAEDRAKALNDAL